MEASLNKRKSFFKGEIMKFIAYAKRKILSVLMPIILCTMNFFVRTDRKMILFVSFNGRSYACNPRYIFEEMRSDEQYKDYTFIWGMDKVEPIEGAKVFRMRRIQYFYYLCKAKYWIFNSKMPNYYRKKNNQVYLQTWHGTPLKKLAYDIENENQTFYRSKMSYQKMLQTYEKDVEKWDYLISANPFSTKIFQSAFNIEHEKILDSGYPRNDIYINYDEKKNGKIKELHNIPSDKKVILYAPTFRDNSFGTKGYKLDLQVHFELWKQILGDDYIVIFKPHYLISNSFNISSALESFVYKMDAKSDINDLYLISDILITDYSSVFFDYSNLKRPIYFYMFDFDNYKNQLRGFYLDVPSDLPNDIDTDEKTLLLKIKKSEFNYDRLATFNKKYNPWQDGGSVKRILKEVLNED